MSPRTKIDFIVTVVSGAVAAITLAQSHAPILPSKPIELLKYLPSAPTGWKMTQSTANNFFLAWICSQATREFQRPAPAQPGVPAGQMFITRVRLMDTGYFPNFNGDFENFRVGKYSNAESLMIGGMPARKIKISASRERLRISVRGRFIVEIETDNQPPNSTQSWIPVFDFRQISSIPDTAPSQLPKPIVVEKLDELHPANNSSSQLMWGGPSNAAATEPH
jgi:hypothetical protein